LSPANSVARTLVLLMVVTGLLHQSFMSARVTLILYAIQLDTPVWLVGLLQGMYPVAGALFSMPIGRLIDRRGPRIPMLWGAVGVGLCALAPALLPGLPSFFISALAVGVAASFFYLAALQVMARLAPPEARVHWLSWSAVSYSIASFTAPLISGFSIDHLSHDWSLVIAAVPAFGVAGALALGRLPLPGPAGSGTAQAHGGLVEMMRRPPIRAIVVIGSIMMVIWDLHAFVVPVYGTQLGLSASTIGMILSAMSLSMLASRLFLPFLIRQMPPVKLMTIALLASATGFLLYPFATAVLAMFLLTALIGFGCGVNQPLSNVLLIEQAPAGRSGEAFGLRNTISHLLQIVMPLAMGTLSASAGIAAVFWLTAGTGYAGAVYARRSWRLFTRPRPPEGS